MCYQITDLRPINKGVSPATLLAAPLATRQRQADEMRVDGIIHRHPSACLPFLGLRVATLARMVYGRSSMVFIALLLHRRCTDVAPLLHCHDGFASLHLL
jgi:hypothetical protein